MSADEFTVDASALDRLATLDEAIQPLGPVDFAAEPEAVFLTGVTRFVGAFLLRDLLATTQAMIYCLVRAADPQAALERIQTNLSAYGLWNDALAPRIIPVVGDLKLPRFGLGESAFADLARVVDVIFHCGSKLSYVAPYAYLKAANVDGTVETLRLATTHRPKPYHYVSSLGILLAYTKLSGGREDDELDATMCPEVGYFQTKYVSERIVRLARERGIAV
ncbi:MAG: SDR family oxidoreductase, partial [Anaerolinea sp.]|nr:SDR family oxidoreductase [Anaerolinea sp.]